MNDGAPPRPDPKAIRGSLVDSGWSAPPPAAAEAPETEQQYPSTRPLPSYDAPEAPGIRDVTVVDREVQTRAKAMREKDTLPPPRRATSAFPPAPPPPPVTRSSPAAAGYRPSSVPPPPPPPIVSRTIPPVAARSIPPAMPRSIPPAAAHSIPPAIPRSIPPVAPSLAPAGNDPPEGVVRARTADTLIRPRPSQPPALPSFAGALAQRVRFAGGEVPLWSLVTPLVLLVALGTAFAAAAVTAAAEPDAAASNTPKPNVGASASVVVAVPAPLPTPPAVSASADEKPKPLTLLERVVSGEDVAVKELSSKPAAELQVEDALSLSLGQSAQAVRAARTLRERLAHDPGLIKDAEVLAQLRQKSDDPETAREALAAMAGVPGPLSADLIYDVWTATSTRTTATDLAHALVYSKEVRAKASKALAVALDLRDAETCEKTQALLGRVASDGDRRTLHLLSKMTRKYGCGPNKRQDCYACLRDGTELDAALKAVKTRREPRPFGG